MSANIEQLLKLHGKTSNSFLALYPGYQYFYLDNPELGCIPYFRTRNAWVGLAEPLAGPEHQMKLLKAFAADAGAEKKAAVLLPIERGFRDYAEKEGFRSFQIGSEPYFDLDLYPPPGRDWLDVSHSARALKHSKGYVVREFQIEEASRALRLELGQMLQDWIESRKTGELGFVNRVEPYTLPQFKKYFLIEGQDRIWAFLACVPIWGSQGWYFIDVIRRNDSPAGCVELLMLEAMKILRSQGAKCISLGVSPLAKLDTSRAAGDSFASRITPYFFDHFQWFYNFQSLYRFKAKFNPTEWRPAYVIHNFGRTDLRLVSVLGDAFVPQGLLTAFKQMLSRKLDLSEYLREMGEWVCDAFVLRAPSRKYQDLVVRAPLSLALITSWILMFVFFRPVDSDVSFSFDAMTSIESFGDAWRVWGLPGFLHWNIWHLSLNLVTFLIVGITFEFFCGTLPMFLAFLTGTLLANTVTAGIFWILVKVPFLSIFTNTLLTEDVGASLGIFGCAGAWSYILKNKKWVWTAIPGMILVIALVTGDYFQINHVVAAFLGLVVARIYFGKIHYEKK
jgi:membrane associated rhomboid family serine protease